MSLTTITVESNDFVAYASVGEVDTAMSVDPVRSSGWDALSNSEKEIRIIAATHRLNILSWLGQKAGGPTQKNAWPRSGLTYEDGSDVPDDEVPYAVELATAIIAANAPRTTAQTSSGGAVKKIKAGSAEIEYSEGVVVSSTISKLEDDAAHALIKQWVSGSDLSLASAGGIAAFGTDSSSADLRYRRSRGFS